VPSDFSEAVFKLYSEALCSTDKVVAFERIAQEELFEHE
jgi:hypothetical protein